MGLLACFSIFSFGIEALERIFIVRNDFLINIGDVCVLHGRLGLLDVEQFVQILIAEIGFEWWLHFSCLNGFEVKTFEEIVL